MDGDGCKWNPELMKRIKEMKELILQLFMLDLIFPGISGNNTQWKLHGDTVQ